MRTRPGLLADALLAWFPPPDPEDVEAQAAAYRVAALLVDLTIARKVR